jgi:nucleoside-diphosphate-sugar epimerase
VSIYIGLKQKNMKNKKICIIGAGGLIGQSLIDKISQQDDVEITAFDRVSPSQKATARWIQGDLEHSENFLDLVKEQDVIIHLAHSNVPLTADQDMARDTYLNLLPTIRILQAIEEAKHYPLFLYPSSLPDKNK